MRGVSAPGKLMIAGEYVVLEGAPCIVASVSARATVKEAASENSLPPEVDATRRLAKEALARELGPLELDASALRGEEGKLGLGSSAALAAGTAALAFAQSGVDITQRATRDRIFDVARRGHRAIARQGSGADVAASVYGGVLHYSMLGLLEPQPWECPITLRVVWTGKEARTNELVERVREFKTSAPKAFEMSMGQLRRATQAIHEALAASSPINLLLAVNEHHHAMNSLGNASGAPLVEERLAKIAELSHMHGGACKASGAGGGDVALCFFKEEAQTERFEQRCRDARFTVLKLVLGVDGVQML